MGVETMVALSLASTAAGAGISALGQMQTGAAQKEAAMYQAQVAQNNSIIARDQAALVRQQGGEAALDQGRKTAQVIGSQRAAYAASGVDVNSGTAVDVQAGAALMGRLDELRVYNKAMQDAFGYDVQATNSVNEGRLRRRAGENAEQAGNLAAIGSLVSGAGSFGSKWTGFARTGAVPSFDFGG